MRDAPHLENVAQAVAAASPDLDSDAQRIVLQTYRLLARGAPASLATIADAAGVPLEQAEDSLRSWPGTFFDDAGRVVGFWGLTFHRLEPTHEMHVDGRTLYGWCAWDTLFLTHALGTQSLVASSDPETGESVRLTVTPEGVSSHHPDDAARRKSPEVLIECPQLSTRVAG